MVNYPKSDPEELRKMDEKRNKELARKRENRLGQVKGRLISILDEIDPEAYKEFEIKYEIMTEYQQGKGTGMFSRSAKVLYDQSPAYRFVLSKKDEPDKKYEIMHLLKPDLDRNIKVADIPQQYQIIDLGNEHIREGLEELRKRKADKRLDSIPGIASIFLIIGGVFFLSSNITGNVIANSNIQSSNIIGAIFLIAGLVGSFFYFRRK